LLLVLLPVSMLWKVRRLWYIPN